MTKGNVGILAAILARENEYRGGDSYGYAIPDSATGKITITKAVGNITSKAYIYALADVPILLGHTRKATSGAITEPNAHPWHFGNIIGAHNGWVTNKIELDTKYPERACLVDSQHIFHQLNEGKPLDELSVHGSITFMKADDPTSIWIARSLNGDMSVRGIGKNRKSPLGIVWSSTDRDLQRALCMAGYDDNFAFECKIERLYRVQDCMLYRMEGKFELGTKYATAVTVYDNDNWKGKGSNNYAISDHRRETGFKPGYIYNTKTRDWEPPKGKGGGCIHRPLALVKKITQHGAATASNRPSELAEIAEQILEAEKTMEVAAGVNKDTQCDSCNAWGLIVTKRTEQGVHFYWECGQWLCNDCATVWGQNTGVVQPVNQRSVYSGPYPEGAC